VNPAKVREYKRYAQNAAPRIHARHVGASGRLDTLTSREAFRRPYGAAPRTARDWQ
jgi:hypothetical protein